MAESSVDMSDVLQGLDSLSGAVRESLARRMGAAGGRIVRDEAKMMAPISDPPYNPTSRGSKQPGTLRDSIYLAYSKKLSTATVFSYSVSWPRAQFWGVFVEFGYVQKHPVFRGQDGVFYTDKTKLLPSPKVVPAKPFLRPAFEGSKARAYQEMIAAGRRELPKLLRGDR